MTPIDLGYEPAPVEESLASARAILAKLFEFPAPVVGEGSCHDCNRHGALLEYGRVRICRPCAHLRKNAALKVAA
jgi:hypothetical protein